VVPTALYNAMIHPLVPYGIRGALWYQGESNLGDGQLYGEKMRALIASWRAAWGQGAFPFYYVQLAPFGYNSTNKYALAEMWEAQRGAMAITNTGMAITTDIGNLRDIHPLRKVPVGQRLALWALARTYGTANMEYSGPLFKSATLEGQKVRVRFDHAAGLKGREGPYASWFELAGKDGIFRRALAKIDAATVLVDKGSVDDPVRIRYGWAEEAEAELFNAAGIPAAPFQADIVP
jgi:sialate O-acetylesterase